MQHALPKPAAWLCGVSLMLLSACGLSAPAGTETAMQERAAGLPALTAATGHDAKSVVRNGLLMHPGVRAAASQVTASADEVKVQRATLFPSLGLRVGGGVGGAGDGDPAVSFVGRQLLLDFGDTKRAVNAADIDLQINYIAFQQAVDEAASELLMSYDAVRMYGRLLEVRRSQLGAMQELETRVAERIDAGAAAAPDRLEIRKRLQSAEFQVHDTELALAEARDRLTRLSGETRGGAVTGLPASCRAVTDTNAARMARLRLAKAELNLERAERATLPVISLAPIAKQSVGSNGIGLGLNLNVESDLLQGGALTARANAARASREGAAAGVEAASRNAGLDGRKLQRDITAAGRRAEMLKRQIALLVETRDLYRSQYLDLGTRRISELLDNEEEIYERRAQAVELESVLLASRLSCAVLDGGLRKVVGVAGASLYGLPLAPEEGQGKP